MKGTWGSVGSKSMVDLEEDKNGTNHTIALFFVNFNGVVVSGHGLNDNSRKPDMVDGVSHVRVKRNFKRKKMLIYL